MPNPPAGPRDFVTIVSGLPRSGTSMMLRMLGAGGMSLLVDGVRAADEDNPYGYHEWEAVKTLKRDASWVAGAVGKGVKVIYYWLYDLPLDQQYRLIFMRRDLDEVLASQTSMLARRVARGLTRPEPAPDDARMKRLFEQELSEIDAWIAGRPCFRRLDVDYRAVVHAPEVEARRVNEFLGGALDIRAMAVAVDPALYRQRPH